MYDCGFYSANNRCGNKDFLGLFYWSIGLPVLSILALGGKRVFHIFGMVVWVVLVIVLVLGQCHSRVFFGKMSGACSDMPLYHSSSRFSCLDVPKFYQL